MPSALKINIPVKYGYDVRTEKSSKISSLSSLIRKDLSMAQLVQQPVS